MHPAPFETSSTDVDGVHVIAVRGELDLNTAPSLEEPLDAAVADGGSAVLIDLSECEFIDSTGIALLVRASQRLASPNGDNGRLALCGCADQVQRVLEVSGLDRSIPVLPGRDEALAALHG